MRDLARGYSVDRRALAKGEADAEGQMAYGKKYMAMGQDRKDGYSVCKDKQEAQREGCQCLSRNLGKKMKLIMGKW